MSRELQPMCSLCGSDFVFLNGSKNNFEKSFQKYLESSLENGKSDFEEFDKEFEEEYRSSKYQNLNSKHSDHDKCDTHYFLFDKVLTLFPLLAFVTRINLVIRINN